MRWIEPQADPVLAEQIQREHVLHPLIAQILVHRFAAEPQLLAGFLHPRLADLACPLELGGMPDAVSRVQAAILRNESVLVFGDYDVDGVTSTALLILFLREFGLSPRYVVPKRLSEGYGLSLDSLERALTDVVPDLLIAVDCGTSACMEVAWLRERGIDVIILDHHTSKDVLPQDCVIVNPHVKDAPDCAWLNLCSVGLVFKFCHAFIKVMRQDGDPKALQMDLREYLDLVALGTIADLVQLTGENRILVHHGLRRLQSAQRPGLCALMEMADLNLGESLDTFDIGFRIGPRINASGRLEDATMPIELLLSGNYEHCRGLARELEQLNLERKGIEREIAEAAEAIVQQHFPVTRSLTLYRRDWHTGVVGIVASRISRQFHRPTVVLGEDADGLLKGSARSISGVNLVEVLQFCEPFLEQWGGHPMAVGLSLRMDHLDGFRSAFEIAIAQLFPHGLPEKKLRIDALAQAHHLDEQLLDGLTRLAPFGQANTEPVFGLCGIQLRSVSQLGNNGHLRFSCTSPLIPDGVAWGMADHPPPVNQPINIAFRFGWNVWRGKRTARLTLLDWNTGNPFAD